jgi:hypothetical protein
MQALISIVSLTKAFLLKHLRISPVMRSNPGAFSWLRLVLISSATFLGVASGFLSRQSFELRTGNVPSPGYGWNF